MDMLAALKLQIEWGADEALEVAPVNRMAPPAGAVAPAKAAPATMPPIAMNQVAMNPASRAQLVAEAANTTEALEQALAAFTECPLARTATRLVFSDGNPQSGLVLIGEAPGAEEDLAGRPFVGEAGRFLDRMLGSVGLPRSEVLVTTVIPWRPPGNRPPTETEVQTCLPFLWRHLTLLRPKIVVTMGMLPLRALTGRPETVRKRRGNWVSLAVPGLPEPVAMLPMLHPAYILQAPDAKKDTWRDLVALRRAVDAL